MDTKTYLQVPGKEEADKYTASIELSNACRTFYKSRMETAEAMKQKWEKNSVSATDANGNGKQKNSIDLAMERLREEMVSGFILLLSASNVVLQETLKFTGLKEIITVVTINY